ncbi:MAG: hypothetical protein SNH27_07400 [Rikenellaceae bacterium]
MKIEILKRHIKPSAKVLKEMEKLHEELIGKRAVRDQFGRLLCHNAYITANVDHNHQMSSVYLKRVKDDEQIGWGYFSEPFGDFVGFVHSLDRSPLTIE